MFLLIIILPFRVLFPPKSSAHNTVAAPATHAFTLRICGTKVQEYRITRKTTGTIHITVHSIIHSKCINSCIIWKLEISRSALSSATRSYRWHTHNWVQFLHNNTNTEYKYKTQREIHKLEILRSPWSSATLSCRWQMHSWVQFLHK